MLAAAATQTAFHVDVVRFAVGERTLLGPLKQGRLLRRGTPNEIKRGEVLRYFFGVEMGVLERPVTGQPHRLPAMMKRGRALTRNSLLAAVAVSAILSASPIPSAGIALAQEQSATPAPATQERSATPAPATQVPVELPKAPPAAAVPAPHAPAAAVQAPATWAPSPAAPTEPRVQPAPNTAGGEEPSATALTLPHDLSPWSMFMNADIVVKAVMIGLAFASLVTWTIWLAKSLEILGGKLRARRAVDAIANAATLMQAGRALGHSGGPGALLVRAAEEERALSAGALDHVSGDGLKERVTSRLSRIEAAASRRMSRGTGLLATIGSTAPFVGLFGTVWGIMNAFIGISQAQTTNLAVVAPGIAEALLATAMGLVAAIPAVVVYNVFARSIAGYRQILVDASAGVERLLSRDLDFRTVPPASAIAAE